MVIDYSALFFYSVLRLRDNWQDEDDVKEGDNDRETDR